MYVRKSNDVGEILDALQDTVIYIASKLQGAPKLEVRSQHIYLEGWALDALKSHMVLN